jgi:hypothetical protein
MAGAFVGWATTYAFVCLGWVFFRSPNFEIAATVLRKLAGQAPGGISWFYLPFWLLVPVVIAAHLIGGVRARQTEPSVTAGKVAGELPPAPPTVHSGTLTPVLNLGFESAFLVTVWVVVLFLFTPVHRNPFIYFRF